MKNPTRRLLLAFPLFLSWAATSRALQVTPASRCAVHCLDSPGGNGFKASDSNTYVHDISCGDLDYSTTDTGIRFRRCMECLRTSPKVVEAESDLKWYICEKLILFFPYIMVLTLLDNLRFTVTTCLFGAPKAPSNGTVASQCDIDEACKPLSVPLTADQLQPSPKTTWDYCTAHDGAFVASGLSSCVNCLQATEGVVYLSNCKNNNNNNNNNPAPLSHNLRVPSSMTYGEPPQKLITFKSSWRLN